MERVHTNTDLDLLSLSFKILHVSEYSIHAITEKPEYPQYNSIIIQVY